jgi:hypothetical protein
MKFRAVRSPVRIARAEPSIRITGPPSRHTPSDTSRSISTPASSERNVCSAGSNPNTTPGAFCLTRARARAPSGTVAAVVTSPSPTSSASARATISATVISFIGP